MNNPDNQLKETHQMTRKDFELIARTIRELPLDHIASEQRRLIAYSFAGHLAATNDQFDKDRFIAACERDQ